MKNTFIKTTIILILFSSGHTFAKTKKIDEAKEIITMLLPFQKGIKNSKFKIDQCKTDKSKWLMLLLANTPFTENIKFSKNCDIEGSYSAKREAPFPVKFKLNNLKNFNSTNFNFLINLVYEPVPMIKVQMQNGTIKGKDDKITFELKYSAQIDPLSKNFIKKDNGGTLHIKAINGKKINKNYPLKM